MVVLGMVSVAVLGRDTVLRKICHGSLRSRGSNVPPGDAGGKGIEFSNRAATCCYSADNSAQKNTMNTAQINKELDVKGLNCPLPILRAKKALADMESGQVLKVIATDPGSVKDFAAFCKQTGNPLLSSTESPAEFTFVISKR